MSNQGGSDEERLNAIRRASERRVRRTTDRARKQDTRCAILAMLGEEEGGELSEPYICGRLPGKRRGNTRHARYHLDVLHRSGLVRHDDGDPRLYRLV